MQIRWITKLVLLFTFSVYSWYELIIFFVYFQKMMHTNFWKISKNLSDRFIPITQIKITLLKSVATKDVILMKSLSTAIKIIFLKRAHVNCRYSKRQSPLKQMSKFYKNVWLSQIYTKLIISVLQIYKQSCYSKLSVNLLICCGEQSWRKVTGARDLWACYSPEGYWAEGYSKFADFSMVE